MKAPYIPSPRQTHTPSPPLAYLVEQTFRAVGSAIGTTGIVLTMAGLFGA